ncbi:MAG TPA: glutathione-disulfide reductase [Burkholderiaceae bacterium]|nr:glutathione-disulfide reductase [Burkholderiaceae bacterium]
MTKDDNYDLIVIGGGSGGVATARRAAHHGARVALAEAGRVGGTCVLRGCVPKKLLMYAAQYGEALREAVGYGWKLGDQTPSFRMQAWQAAKTRETSRLEQVYRDLLHGSGVELIGTHARLDGPGAVRAAERLLRAPHIVLATGSSPIRDSIEGIAECPTSDDLLELTELPASAAVVGGGYIAIEFASMLARLGVRATVLYRDRLPLRGFDEDLRTRVATALVAAGVVLKPSLAPTRIAREGGGWRLDLPDGQTLFEPWVLNATGRRPNSSGLGLETVGITTDAKRAVPVDSQRRTKARGVYAIGDLTNQHNLTPVAIAQGRALADRLFGEGPPLSELDHVPTAVFTLPPLGTVGLSEQELVAQGRSAIVYEADFRPMRAAFCGGTERCYMKMLVDPRTDFVLGLHMLGGDAPEIIQSLAVALSAGATKSHFDSTIAVHPTAAEEWVLMRQPTRRIAGL